MTVNQILSNKGKEVFSILSTNTVYEALTVMSEKTLGNSSRILFLRRFVWRDYARKLFWKLNLQSFVHEIMETDVVTVSPSDNLKYCMELMKQKILTCF
jgi:predicted transcriptional regulator